MMFPGNGLSLVDCDVAGEASELNKVEASMLTSNSNLNA